MNIINEFFVNVKRALTEKSFGRTIVSKTTGNAMRYLLFLMLIIGTITMASFEVVFNDVMKNVAGYVASEVPEFEFRNGYINVQGEMPVIKKYDDSIFIIDTTGKTTEDMLSTYKNGVLISDTRLIVKRNSVETRSYNLRDFRGINFTKRDMIQFSKNIKLPFMIIVFVLGVIFIYLGKLIGVIFLSLIGLIVNKIIKSKLTYDSIFKLTIYAITLPSIVKAITEIVDVEIPLFFIVYYGIAVYYFIGYMKELRITGDLSEVNEEV